MDAIHDSALIYQPSHPVKGRNEVRYGLDYQCFLRKDSPLNREFDSGFQGLLAQRWGEPNSLPFTKHFFVPSRCQGGCSPWGSGWSSEPWVRRIQPAPSPLRPPHPAPSKLQLHSSLLLPSWLLRNLLAPNPTSSPEPCQRRCSSLQLPFPSRGSAKGDGLGDDKHRLFCYTLFYYVCFITYLSIQPSLHSSIHVLFWFISK